MKTTVKSYYGRDVSVYPYFEDEVLLEISKENSSLPIVVILSKEDAITLADAIYAMFGKKSKKEFKSAWRK